MKISNNLSSTSFLQVADLSLLRDDKLIFSKINFSLNAGEILHLKGSNGSGKTSLLKTILGILPPANGEIIFHTCPKSNKMQNKALFIGHESGLREELTVSETINFFMQLENSNSSLNQHKLTSKTKTKTKTKVKEQMLAEILQKFKLADNKNSFVEKLSAGQKRRLTLTRLAIFNRRLWILDEAFNNLDSLGIDFLFNLMTNHIQNAGAIIFTSHTEVKLATQIEQTFFAKLKTLDLNNEF